MLVNRPSLQTGKVLVCLNESPVLVLWLVWSVLDWQRCPSLLYWFQPSRQHRAASLPNHFHVLLCLNWPFPGCVNAQHGCGRVDILPPFICIPRQLSILCPFSNVYVKVVVQWDRKWAPSSQMCVRSDWGGCGHHVFSNHYQENRPLSSPVGYVTGQPGDGGHAK